MSDKLCYLCLAGPATIQVKGYKIDVCQTCWQGAKTGWPAGYEASLFNALQRAGLLIPDRNPNGKLPRTYQPPADFNL